MVMCTVKADSKAQAETLDIIMASSNFKDTLEKDVKEIDGSLEKVKLTIMFPPPKKKSRSDDSSSGSKKSSKEEDKEFEFMTMSIDTSGDWNHDTKPKLGEMSCPMECPMIIPADYEHLTAQKYCANSMEGTMCKTVTLIIVFFSNQTN